MSLYQAYKQHKRVCFEKKNIILKRDEWKTNDSYKRTYAVRLDQANHLEAKFKQCATTFNQIICAIGARCVRARVSGKFYFYSKAVKKKKRERERHAGVGSVVSRNREELSRKVNDCSLIQHFQHDSSYNHYFYYAPAHLKLSYQSFHQSHSKNCATTTSFVIEIDVFLPWQSLLQVTIKPYNVLLVRFTCGGIRVWCCCCYWRTMCAMVSIYNQKTGVTTKREKRIG